MVMSWRKSRTMHLKGARLRWRWLPAVLILALPCPAVSVPTPTPKRIHAVDADNHNILLNRPGIITLVIGTSQDSQEAARQAGLIMHPLQGRPDFQLIVAVDLHDSIATWAPSIAVSRMKSSLDAEEAIELKPYFLKNDNRSNPRNSCHVVPDFKGTLFAELGWPNKSDDLRAVIFGSNGREYQRFDKIDNMNVLFNSVRSAISDYLDLKRARIAAAPPIPVTHSTALSPVPPPLPPPLPSTAMIAAKDYEFSEGVMTRDERLWGTSGGVK